jgi:hypothetical protein
MEVVEKNARVASRDDSHALCYHVAALIAVKAWDESFEIGYFCHFRGRQVHHHASINL